MKTVQQAQVTRSDRHTRLTCYFSMIIAVCSVMTFVVILVVVLAVVPKVLSLMDTAQRTLNNLESVSEELKSLELTETIKNIEDNTTNAMQDVSTSMEQLRELDMDSLNRSIQGLSESVSEFRALFGA